MQKTLKNKLRKMFRKKQRLYWQLSFDENAYKLIDKLPLNAYEELEKGLTDEEFEELKDIFKEIGKEKVLLAIFPSDVWIKRCCSDLRVFDTLSDSQLKEILDNEYGILQLFVATNHTERQCRIISLLDTVMLGNFMYYAGKKDCLTINEFLVGLCQKEEKATEVEEREKIADIFRKIASISDLAIANLLGNTQYCVTKRILEQVRQENRDLLSICKQISKEELYDVLSKSNFALLERADGKLYSWFYANFSETDKIEYLAYLADEKLDQIGIFDAGICAGIFALRSANSWKEEFIKKVFTTRPSEDFNAFYEELSYEEKDLMFETLLKLGDKEGEEIVKAFLKEKHNLSLLESLLNEKYVTN